MFSRGTPVAAWNHMNDGHPNNSASLLAPVCAEPPACGDRETAEQREDGDELDKYDLSTLACTD
jgi:hypothetical protein